MSRVIITVVTALTLVACSSSSDGYQDPADRYQHLDLKTFTAQLLDGPYLYAEDHPDLDPADHESAQALLTARRNAETRDRWSYLVETSAFDSLFQAGEVIAWGFTLRQQADGHLRLAIVQPGSPAERAGLRRGDTLLYINDLSLAPPIDSDAYRAALGPSEEGYTATFTWQDQAGAEHSAAIGKELITIDPLPTAQVLQVGSTDPVPVGYLAFHDFIGPAVDQLDAAFASFQAAGIRELVVDLRYNGGGSLGVMLFAGSLMHISEGGMIAAAGIGSRLIDTPDVFFTLDFNGWEDWRDDETYHFSVAEHAVDLDRIIFLTSSSSASASEALINALEPYHDVVLIGSATHGKPVGMTTFSHDESGMTLVPLTFAIRNALGAGDYFDGIPVDVQRPDDLDHALGDPQETMLAEALHLIATGAFTQQAARAMNQPAEPAQDLQAALGGLRAITGHL